MDLVKKGALIVIDNQCEKCGEKITESGSTCKDCKDDMVNSPKHYNMGNIEAIDVIDSWNLNFNLGNIIAYALRADYKGEKIRDLNKIIWYAKREITRTGKEREDEDKGNAANWNG